MKYLFYLGISFILISCNNNRVEDNQWVKIFNGVDLTDWTIKISGYQLGDNFNNTFLVSDGLLKVNYDLYDTFRGEFGHIYYNEKLSSYRLRLSYRFTGEQVSGGPGWAFRNNGIMLHCQNPATILTDQDFPVSIEAQFLGGDGTTERTTMNLCTPGTNVIMDGELIRRHCTNSNSQTYHGDQWVEVEVIVYADSLIHHLVNGDTVMTYYSPQIDATDLPEGFPMPDGTLLDAGYISLQAESHPIEFRNIELLKMDK